MDNTTLVFTELIKSSLQLMIKSKRLNLEKFNKMTEDIKQSLNSEDIAKEEKEFLNSLFSAEQLNETTLSIQTLRLSFRIFQDKAFVHIGRDDAEKIIAMALQKAFDLNENASSDLKKIVCDNTNCSRYCIKFYS